MCTYAGKCTVECNNPTSTVPIINLIKLLEDKLQLVVDRCTQHSVPSLFAITSLFKKSHKCWNYNCKIRNVKIAQFIPTVTNTVNHVFLKQKQNNIETVS